METFWHIVNPVIVTLSLPDRNKSSSALADGVKLKTVTIKVITMSTLNDFQPRFNN
jgi:hypothetical protein